MSEHATHFIDPTTFRALTHEPVALGLFDDPSDPIHHISLAKEADVIVVAPATANVIAKLACGIADDLLSTTLLAATSPIIVAPAMNSNMWRAAATQENMQRLREARRLGCGVLGEATLPAVMSTREDFIEIETIADTVEQAHCESSALAGERILITAAGPTHEPIDPGPFHRQTGPRVRWALRSRCAARAHGCPGNARARGLPMRPRHGVLTWYRSRRPRRCIVRRFRPSRTRRWRSALPQSPIIRRHSLRITSSRRASRRLIGLSLFRPQTSCTIYPL